MVVVYCVRPASVVVYRNASVVVNRPVSVVVYGPAVYRKTSASLTVYCVGVFW